MNCEQKITQGLRGVCGRDSAGFSRIWQINRKDIETVTYSGTAGQTDMITAFTLASGAHAFLVPFENESVKPKYDLVKNDAGSDRYKHSVEINTIARTVQEINDLRAGDQVFIFELKQDVVGGGRYVAYGFDCGLYPASETSALLKSGTTLMLESYKDQTEPVQFRVIHNATNAATRLMLDGFLAA